MKAYVDDMIVKSILIDAHLANLTKMFQILQKFNMHLNSPKYTLESVRKVPQVHRSPKENRCKFQEGLCHTQDTPTSVREGYAIINGAPSYAQSVLISIR